MIDGIKLKYEVACCKDFIKQSESLISWDIRLQRNTAEIKYHEGTYRSLNFRLHESKTLIIKGSLHKYYTDGINHTDFNQYQIVEAIDDLKAKFGFNLDKLKIVNLEISVNLIPPIRSEVILKGIMFYKRLNMFRSHVDSRRKLIECKGSNFYIKLYDKKNLMKLLSQIIEHELLKFEIKFMTHEKCRQIGIGLISDLKSNMLAQSILEAFNLVIKNMYIYDYSIDCVTENYSDYSNNRFWENQNIKSRNTILHHKNNLMEISKEHGNDIYGFLLDSVKEKLCKMNKTIAPRISA